MPIDPREYIKKHSKLDDNTAPDTTEYYQGTPIDPNEGLDPITKYLSELSVPTDNPVSGYMAGLTKATPGSSVLGGITEASADLFNPIDAFKRGYGQMEGKVDQIEEENPYSSTFGEITSSIPQYLGGMGALKGLGKGLQGGKALLSTMGKGAAVNSAMGQAKRGLEFDPTGTAIDAALGAGGELFGAGIGKGFEKGADAYRKVRDFFKSGTGKATVEGWENRIPVVGGGIENSRAYQKEALQNEFTAQEAARKAALEEANAKALSEAASQRAAHEAGKNQLASDFAEQEFARKSATEAANQKALSEFEAQEARKLAEQQARQATSQEYLSKLKTVTDAEAGAGLKDATLNAKKKLSAEYGEAVDPLIKEHGAKPVSAQKVRDALTEGLSSERLLDSKGNLIKKSANEGISPQREAFKKTITKVTRTLKKNPTIEQLTQLAQDLDSLAKSDPGLSTNFKRIYGNISRATKEAIADGVESLAGPEAAAAVKAARASYAKSAPVLKTLAKLAKSSPEAMVKGAGTKLPQSFIETAMSAQPGVKAEMGEVLLNNISNRAKSPKALTEIIDSYGRDTLQKVLSPEQFQNLIAAEKAFHAASAPLTKGVAPELEKFVAAKAPEAIPLNEALLPKAEKFVAGQAPELASGKLYKSLVKNIDRAGKVGKTLSKGKGAGKYLGPVGSTLINQNR